MAAEPEIIELFIHDMFKEKDFLIHLHLAMQSKRQVNDVYIKNKALKFGHNIDILLKYLLTQTKIKNLTLSLANESGRINLEKAKILVEVINNNNITKLDLSENTFEPGALKYILFNINPKNMPKQLLLNNIKIHNNISYKEKIEQEKQKYNQDESISKAARDMEKARIMHDIKNEISDWIIKYAEDAKNNQKFEILSLKQYMINNEFTKTYAALITQITDNMSLQKQKFKVKRIDIIEQIAEKDKTFRFLALTEDHKILLSNELEDVTNTWLKEYQLFNLYLARAKLTPGELNEIYKALKKHLNKNNYIKTLDLSKNKLNKDHIDTLKDILTLHISEVNLNNNKFTQDDFHELVYSLKADTFLQELYLYCRHCHYSIESLKHLIDQKVLKKVPKTYYNGRHHKGLVIAEILRPLIAQMEICHSKGKDYQSNEKIAELLAQAIEAREEWEQWELAQPKPNLIVTNELNNFLNNLLNYISENPELLESFLEEEEEEPAFSEQETQSEDSDVLTKPEDDEEMNTAIKQLKVELKDCKFVGITKSCDPLYSNDVEEVINLLYQKQHELLIVYLNEAKLTHDELKKIYTTLEKYFKINLDGQAAQASKQNPEQEPASAAESKPKPKLKP